MKKVIFLSLLVFIVLSNRATGQVVLAATVQPTKPADKPDPTLYGRYFWKKAVIIYGCSSEGVISTPHKTVTTYIGQKFDVVNVISDSKVVVKICDYDPSEQENIATYTYAGDIEAFRHLDPAKQTFLTNTDEQYFLIDRDKLSAAAVIDENTSSSISFGVLSLPFKLRFAPLDFSASSSLGAAVSYNFRQKVWRNTAHSIILGAGFTQINLDSTTTRRNSADLAKSNSFSALTLCSGYMLTNNNVQVGLFIGSDILGAQNNNHFGWRFQGQPYFSIGLGFSIFTITKFADNAKNDSDFPNAASKKSIKETKKSERKAKKKDSKKHQNADVVK